MDFFDKGVLKDFNFNSEEPNTESQIMKDIVDFYQENMEHEADNLVPFASDGCSMAFALKKGTLEIRAIPMDSLEYEYSKECSNNFNEFIQDMYSGNLVEY